PVALAVLAPSALDVEGEAAGAVAADARLWDRRKQLADRGEQSDVGRRVGARRPADRALVDLDDLVDLLQALDPIVPADRLARPEQLARQGAVQDLGDERALAAPGDTGDGRERAERNGHVEVLEVVLPRPANDELLAVALAAFLRDGNLALA